MKKKNQPCLYNAGRCGKISADFEAYCPKHLLFLADEEKKALRVAQKAAKTRAFREAVEEALRLSPLRAENPNFKPKKIRVRA